MAISRYETQSRDVVTMRYLRNAQKLRPAGGVKHSDSDLVETRMLSAKKRFAEEKAVFLATPENFKGGGWWFSHFNWAKCAENTRFPLASN